MKVKPKTPIANGAPATAPPDMSLPLHSGDAEAIDTSKVVELKLGLPYERALAVAHRIIAAKCGSGTWHGYEAEFVAGGVAFHLWWEGTADGQPYRQDTGYIYIFTSGELLFKPYGLRDTDNTQILGSPSLDDVPPDNDFPQIAREVVNALIAAQGETASGGTETPQSAEGSSMPQTIINYGTIGSVMQSQGDINVGGNVVGRDEIVHNNIEEK